MDQLAQLSEGQSSAVSPSGGGSTLYPVGSHPVDQAPVYQPPVQAQPPPAAPGTYTPPQWVRYNQDLEMRLQQTSPDAESWRNLNRSLDTPQKVEAFKRAYSEALSPTPPPAAYQPPPAAAATPPPAAAPPQAAPPQQQVAYYQDPRLTQLVETVAGRMQRIEEYNAGQELARKMDQMRATHGVFDEQAVLKMAYDRGINNLNQLDDAYMAWDRIRTNAVQLAAQQGHVQYVQRPMQQHVQQPQPQAYPQYPHGYPQQPQQQYAPPPQQQAQQMAPRAIPPPTRASVQGGGPPQQMQGGQGGGIRQGFGNKIASIGERSASARDFMAANPTHFMGRG